MENNFNIEERAFTGFHTIFMKGIGNIFITQDSQFSVKLKGETETLEKIRTEIINGELVISTKGFMPLWYFDAPFLEIYISLPEIKGIKVSGKGKIEGMNEFNCETLLVSNSGKGEIFLSTKAKSITTKLSGLGDIVLKGTAEYHSIDITGSGNVNAGDLLVEKTFIDCLGVVDCIVNSVKELDVKVSGTGTVKYKGKPQVTSRLSGFASLEVIA